MGGNMKDSQGNNISIGDRVTVLWNFDNKLHPARIVDIKKNVITLVTSGTRITTTKPSRLTKLPDEFR